MGILSRGVACAIIVGSALAASPAFADPSLSEKETARSLMEDGDAKRDKNDLRAALKSYEAADAIMKVPTTGLEVARTQSALGLLLESKETAGRVARSQPKPGEPPPFVAARKAAEQLVTELGTRIPSVAVAFANVDAGQTPTLTFDGESVPPAAMNAPRKVNPGTHIIVARLGSVERREEPRVAEKEQRTITIDFKSAAPPPVAVIPTNKGDKPETPPTPPDRTTEPSSGGGVGKPLMYGGFAVGVIGIGVGSVTGLMSISKVNDLKPSCKNDKCPPDKQSDLDSAKSMGTVSTVAFIVGGLGVVAGVAGIILSGKESKPETEGRIHPVVGPTYLGLDGTF